MLQYEQGRIQINLPMDQPDLASLLERVINSRALHQGDFA